MTKTEGAGLVGKLAFGASFLTEAAGPGFTTFPISGGGLKDAFKISDALLNGGHHDFTLNPFGGYNTYDAFVNTNPHTGAPEVAWHTVYHPYTFGQGADMLMGEATLALLATAGVSKLINMAGRRMSRGRASK